MIHVDLFSGIGGFALACDWAGVETVCFCEIDKFCQKVLRKHYPNVPIVEDVNDVEEIKRIVANATGERRERQRTPIAIQGTEQRPEPAGKLERRSERPLSLLTAGFPCQPFSAAGRRKGANDNRYLWPQTLRVIEAVRPDWVLLENVVGILSMVFPDSEAPVAEQASFLPGANDQIADYDTICGGIDRDLRQAGYETLWLVIPACGVGAPHRRDRVWVLAHDPQRRGLQGCPGDLEAEPGGNGKNDRLLEPTDSHASHASTERLPGICQGEQREQLLHAERGSWQENWYEVAQRFCVLDAGVSDRLARYGVDHERLRDKYQAQKLKALGNAVVPHIPYIIIKVIKENN